MLIIRFQFPALLPARLLALCAALSVTAASLVFVSPVFAQGGPPPGPVPIPVMTVQLEPVQSWSQYSGRLTAVNSAEIRPRVGGPIEKVLFAEGELVSAGKVLFQIDARSYRAVLAAADAALTLARQERTRAEKLRGTVAFSQNLLDLRLAEEKAAQSAVTLAQLNLDYTEVKAPFAGRMGRAELTAGNLIETNMGAPLLTTIMAQSPIYAEFNVEEATYLAVRGTPSAQLPVILRLDTAEAGEFHGTLHAFDNRIDATTGTIRARAIFDNPEGLLVPGMFASVRLGNPPQERLAVPESVIGTDQNKRFVYVVGTDSTVQYREIKTGGTASGGLRLVKAGLETGDRVIVSATQKVQPGMAVIPQEVVSAASVKKAEQ
jgi:membrane fusion protein, multidrug efflux system